jgi:hypothetical protein
MQKLSGTTIILRLEGLALALACLWLFSLFHQSWWLFALLILTPDLSMLGYLAGPKVGAALYNAAHSWVTVAGFFFLFWYFPEWFDWINDTYGYFSGKDTGGVLLLSLPFILGAHIGIDRVLGYGLKHRTGFKDTHLGRIGKTPLPLVGRG